MNTMLLRTLAPTALLTLGAAAGLAQFDPAPARQAVLAAEPAVVTVQVVAKITSDEGPEDAKSETTGIVLDASGLTVVSLSGMDPSALMQLMLGQDPGLQISVSSVTIRLGGGQEVPAKIVLRDMDQDLAFLRPEKKPEQPMAFVDFKNSATRDLLDPLVVVGRMGRLANRTISARAENVEGLMERPRRRYFLASRGVDQDAGSLVLTPDGKVVGMVGTRAVPMAEGDISILGFMLMGMGRSPQVVVPSVIPASDIAAVAAQAPEDAPKATDSPAGEDD